MHTPGWFDGFFFFGSREAHTIIRFGLVAGTCWTASRSKDRGKAGRLKANKRSRELQFCMYNMKILYNVFFGDYFCWSLCWRSRFIDTKCSGTLQLNLPCVSSIYCDINARSSTTCRYLTPMGSGSSKRRETVKVIWHQPFYCLENMNRMVRGSFAANRCAAHQPDFSLLCA